MISKESVMATGNAAEDSAPTGPRPNREIDQSLEHIRQALSGLRYGEVSVIIQDGVIVQVERTERKRLRRSER